MDVPALLVTQIRPDAHDYWALLLALVLGGVIGLERELNGRPAGLRTHILVCLSSTMLILVSRAAAHGDALAGEAARIVFDPNRMGAGIVTGIGFLGAACVMRSGDVLRGLTTGACIWFVAGLGIVLGTGHYLLATAVTAVVLFVLTMLNRIAAGIDPVLYRRLVVAATTSDAEGAERLGERIRGLLKELGLRVVDVGSVQEPAEGRCELTFHVVLRTRFLAPRVTGRVASLDGVRRVAWKSLRSD